MNENEYEMCLTHLNYIAIGNTYKIISCAVELSILFHTFFCVIITMIIFHPQNIFCRCWWWCSCFVIVTVVIIIIVVFTVVIIIITVLVTVVIIIVVVTLVIIIVVVVVL